MTGYEYDYAEIAKRVSAELKPVLEKLDIPPPIKRSEMSTAERAEFIRKNGQKAYLELPI